MEHPDVAVGYLTPDPQFGRRAFRLYEHQHAGEHLTVEAMFRLSDAVLRSKRLLNAVMRLRPTYRSGMTSAVRSAEAVRR